MAQFLNTTINGLASGSIFALAAVGLSLVYGILKLVNFAHGDFMTLGAYVAVAVNVAAGLPLVVALLAALAAVAVLSLGLEYAIWRPMRVRGAGVMQLLLMSIGLAFVIRNMILFAWTAEQRSLRVDEYTTYRWGDVYVSRNQVIVIITALVLLVGTALLLKFTTLGKSMRALSDSVDLAEVSGIRTGRVIAFTWILGGSLAGLAGVFLGIVTAITPNMGFIVLLSVFASVILGGIGSAYGALVGGLLLGLVQEWSTNVIDPTWKSAVGFVVLILVLLVRPQGIFGARTREV